MKFRTKTDAENFLSSNEISGEVIFNRDFETYEISFLSSSQESDLKNRTRDLFVDFVIEDEEELLVA